MHASLAVGGDSQTSDSAFFSQGDSVALETPDLKIIDGNTLASEAVPSTVSVQVLGDVFGSDTVASSKKEITNYTVQAGDTAQSIAAANDITVNTLLGANQLSNASQVSVGQTLTILPVNGLLYVVKSGDTVEAIAQKYKADPSAIVSYNNLANETDIYIGDILVIPGGVQPSKAAAAAPLANQIPVANGYFIFPAQGMITQGLHYYNAVDLANHCGTPIYAAAAGTIQRVVANNQWNNGMGNYITILHGNGTVTYYGHIETALVSPGQKVDVGTNIALMGRTGDATGCHVHFEVIGAANPLAKYAVGTKISYTGN